MKKKPLILFIYSFYILCLFVLSIYYQSLEESVHSSDFATSLGKRLGYIVDFFGLTVSISWLFFAIISFVHRKLSFAFVLLVPLLLFFIGLFVFLVGDFILWISQLHIGLSQFQELFLLTSISSTLLMIWIFGDVFRRLPKKFKAHKMRDCMS